MRSQRFRSIRTARTGAAVAALVTVALVAAACTSTDADDAAAGTGPVTISYATEQEFSAYNNDNANASSVANSVVLNLVMPYLTYVDPHGQVQRKTEVGTVEQLSDNPLTIRYTLDERAVWSDGVPITAKDFYLAWMSHNTAYPQFQPASTTGISDITLPTDDPDGRVFTAVYTKPFGDWDTAMATQVSPLQPAHVIEQQTGTSIPDAIRTGDAAAITKIADYWNNRWVGFSPGALPPADEIPSGGPYRIASWQAGQSISLLPNESWWGTPPKNDGITIRFINQQQQVQALQNGDADVIEPQPNVDLITSLDALGATVERNSGSGFSYDHVDFNFRGKFGNADLRKALALCTPRQDIIDKLIKPVDPSAELMQSRLTYPVQDEYDAVAATADPRYSSVDIAGAKELIARSGVTDLSVNAIYLGNPNQRHEQTMALMAQSCGQAGFTFNVRALTPKEWGETVTSGAYDIGEFAWSGSGMVSELQPLFTSTSDYNYGHYANAAVDALLAQLVQTTDKAEQLGLLVQVEQHLWDDMVTLPVFAWPLLNAHTPRVSGVVLNTTQTMATYNADEWSTS